MKHFSFKGDLNILESCGNPGCGQVEQGRVAGYEINTAGKDSLRAFTNRGAGH